MNKRAVTVVALVLGWGVASGLTVATVAGVGPSGARGAVGSTGIQGLTTTGPKGEDGDAGPAGSKGTRGLTGDSGDAGAAGNTGPRGYVPSWKVTGIGGVDLNVWDCTLSYCPAYHDSWWGGSVTITNTGSQSQHLRFDLQVKYGTSVECTIPIDETVFDQAVANGDDIPEYEAGSKPAPPLAAGKSTKLFLVSDRDNNNNVDGVCFTGSDDTPSNIVAVPAS